MSSSRIIDVSGGAEGAVHVLEEVWEIGRGPSCDLRIVDLTVSRLQARVRRAGDHYEIEHLGSSAPTLVNDRPVSRSQPLHAGDLIRVADRVLRFEGPRAAWGGPPARITDEATVLGTPGDAERIVHALSASYSLLDESARAEQGPGVERLTAALKTIRGFSRKLAAILDVEELLPEIPERLIETFAAARAAIMVKDSAGALAPRSVKRRHDEDRAELKVSRTVVHHVTELREAVLSRDAGADSRFAGGLSIVAAGVRSIMCAPLIWRDQLVGAIYLDSDSAGAFGEADLELLVGIADQCATALGIAQLHREMTRRQLVEQDLRLAQRIQKSFLPKATPQVPDMSFCAAYAPARHVGGDFYDFIALPPRHLAIVVGDISGKGVGAALHMARVSRDVRFLAAADPTPAAVATRMNEAVLASGQDDMFVTLLYALLDLESHALLVANCGHLPPVLRRRGQAEARLLEVEAGNPIGLLPQAEFGYGRYQLEPGDSLLLYTDGLTEAMNPARELLGIERVLAALSGGGGGPKELLERAEVAMQRHALGAPASDDTTLLSFGINTSHRRERS